MDNQADLKQEIVLKTARHSKTLLSEIIHVKTLEEALRMNISYAIATSARQSIISTSRICFTPQDIPWQDLGKSPAIVFGSESYGLDNKDVALCDFIVTIPTSSTYTSVNLSHSVAIMSQYFFLNYLGKTAEISYESASFELKQQLEVSFSLYADKFLRKERAHVSKEIFHNLIARSRITEGEASNLIGALKAWKYHFNLLEKNNKIEK